MVTTSETTQIITQPKIEESVEPSIKRWFKHLCYLPASSRYFSKQDKQAIADAVQQAEHGHVGEIQVVIEGHIPVSQAYRQNTRLRAQQLFAELGVWDTALKVVIVNNITIKFLIMFLKLVLPTGFEPAHSRFSV